MTTLTMSEATLNRVAQTTLNEFYYEVINAFYECHDIEEKYNNEILLEFVKKTWNEEFIDKNGITLVIGE